MFEHVFMHHHAMFSSVAQSQSEVRDIHCDMRNNNEVEHGSSWTLLQSVRSHLLLHFRDSSCIFQHACMSLNVRICYARSICSYIFIRCCLSLSQRASCPHAFLHFCCPFTAQPTHNEMWKYHEGRYAATDSCSHKSSRFESNCGTITGQASHRQNRNGLENNRKTVPPMLQQICLIMLIKHGMLATVLYASQTSPLGLTLW